MFSEMINDLKNGCLPEPTPLKKRLRFAFTKKLGIIKQPYLLWPPDPKQNPPATHLLWAAIILEDADSIALATDILIQERHEKMAARAGSLKGKNIHEREAVIQSVLQDLNTLLPPGSLQSMMQEKIRKFFY
ncbi:MAG: hypothetical protein H8E41_03220 [Desulfobulbaceae bacterium]|uniref:Uncharacterized protein n=1 Tax=Candidatus Desulfobia pelagia TaxID=2841692 RepID=A0A8J6NBX7_9BACT|nr:hypothetical protein [Candidatus Desulfobia pelagia]